METITELQKHQSFLAEKYSLHKVAYESYFMKASAHKVKMSELQAEIEMLRLKEKNLYLVNQQKAKLKPIRTKPIRTKSDKVIDPLAILKKLKPEELKMLLAKLQEQ
jgi:hypothetical protein